MKQQRHPHRKLKFCVSGAAETAYCGMDALNKAKELGKEIVRQGGILTTGATTGFPFWASIGAKEEGGISIGISPASTEREHLQTYRLPIDYLDVIIYTGFGYSGRNLLLTRSSDAVFVGCGRVGTINEFTIAFEDGKPIGILEGDWETPGVIKTILEKGHRGAPNVVFDADPRQLVQKVAELVKKQKAGHYGHTGELEEDSPRIL